MQDFGSKFCLSTSGITISRAKHMKYASYQSRLATFNSYHTNIEQSPESLARAGFFYTGTGDLMRCFYCDGGLRCWVRTDDPWKEHKKWFPQCDFISQMADRPKTESDTNLITIYNSQTRLPLYIRTSSEEEIFTPTTENLELIISAKAVLHLGYNRVEVGRAFELCSKDIG